MRTVMLLTLLALAACGGRTDLMDVDPADAGPNGLCLFDSPDAGPHPCFCDVDPHGCYCLSADGGVMDASAGCDVVVCC